MKNGHFAERIKALRTALGLSQEEFAEKVGVRRQQVIRWEKGEQRAPRARLENICGLLGITEREFWDPHFSFSDAHKLAIRSSARLLPGPYLGTPVDETGRALSCPRCGETKFKEGANYCGECGMSLRNACDGPGRHPNRPTARFCEECGAPTSWSRRDDELPEGDEGR